MVIDNVVNGHMNNDSDHMNSGCLTVSTGRVVTFFLPSYDYKL